MRIYLSGPMTGIPDHNFAAFENAAYKLRGEGHFVINPAELSVMFGTSEEIAESFDKYYGALKNCGNDFFERCRPAECFMKQTAIARSVMDADLAAVRSCDAIYLLRGWESSRGAKKELTEAIAHGLQIIQEGGAQ